MIAGLAVVTAAVALPAGAASADVAGTPGPVAIDPGNSADGPKLVKPLPAKDKPANARRATAMPTKMGKRGQAFDPAGVHANITGGTPVNASEYPSVVGIESFYYLDDGTGTGGTELWVSTCTGSVLSPTKVLTAGHCIVDLPYGTTFVLAGQNVLDETSTNGFVTQASSSWTSPTFNYPAVLTPGTIPRDDVSVLTLRKALPVDYVPTALADQGAADPADGTDATIVGYGATARGASDYGILRAATVPIKADATCATTWGTAFDPNRMMCAGTPPTTDTCAGDSGGPIFTGPAGARVQVGITDWGSDVCGSQYGVYEALNYYSNVVKQQLTVIPANNLDFTGDGHSDLFGRETSTGALVLGSGAGFATSTYGGMSGLFYATTTNFNRFTKLFRVNNWSGDGYESVFARDSAGRLYNYRSDGQGNFRGGLPPQIGSAWNMFNDIMVTNNWIGNGLPNLIGRKPNGELWLYNANGTGGWLNPHGTRIGTGWGRYNTILTPGSWMGDGKQSLIGRNAAGDLYLYNSDGKGGWTNPSGTKIGTGWNGFKTFMSPGDWSGDNLVDLLGVTPAGQVKMYTTNGKGAWINARGAVIDTGWNSAFNMIF